MQALAQFLHVVPVLDLAEAQGHIDVTAAEDTEGVGHKQVVRDPGHLLVAEFHGDGADREVALGAHFEHAHFVVQQLRTPVGGSLREDDDAQPFLDALLDLHAGGLAAFRARPVDPDGAEGIAAPADDGPPLDLRLGDEDERVGGRHHDGVDVAAVVGDQDAGVVWQLALDGHTDASGAVDVAAEPGVGLVQTPVVGSRQLARQGTRGADQGQPDEGEEPAGAPPVPDDPVAVVERGGQLGQEIEGSVGHANKCEGRNVLQP